MQKNLCWCERCGDSLETRKIIDENDVSIVNWEYYCEACNITYILVEKKRD